MSELTHLDRDGRASMVDVGDKESSSREAVAEASIYMAPTTLTAIRDGSVPKGDVLAAARIAGIMAAKRTHELVPLCHPLQLSKIAVDFEVDDRERAGHRRRFSALQWPHRRRDGGADRGQRRRADHLRHGEGPPEVDDDFRHSPASQARRQVRRLGAGALGRKPGNSRAVNVRLILFAGLRQAAGFKEDLVSLPESATVGDLLDQPPAPARAGVASTSP